MSRLFILLIITLSYSSLNAQGLSADEQEAMNGRLQTFMDLTKAEDYENLMDYIYPKIFTMATKAQMVEAFKGIEAMGMDMVLDEMAMGNSELIYEDGEDKYVLGNYSLQARVILTKPALQEPEAANQMLAAFKAQFGPNNATYDSENYTINISGDKYLVAINESAYDSEWYFMEYDKANPQIVNMLLPAPVIDEINSRLK